MTKVNIELKSSNNMPVYPIILSENDITVIPGGQLPLLPTSDLVVGNPGQFMIQIFWNLPEGKPEANSRSRNYHLARVMSWLSNMANLGEVLFGIGHVPTDAIESITEN